jgi:hypothetical protein
METIGQFVQEAVDFMNGGSYKFAFPPTARAIEATVKKISGKEILSDDDYKRFIKENWELLVFMGMPRALPLPLNVPFGLKRIVPQFNVHHGAEEIILLLVSQSLRLGKFPPGFEFDSSGIFEIKKGKLFLPLSLVSGLLGSVIFHPVNKTEEIGEKYWMNISDFKMFISELWGRRDLADRIIKFYLE